jgi:hypothetical protein
MFLIAVIVRRFKGKFLLLSDNQRVFNFRKRCQEAERYFALGFNQFRKPLFLTLVELDNCRSDQPVAIAVSLKFHAHRFHPLMWQQNERCHCPVVIGDPTAAVARESEKDRSIFTLALSDSRNAVTLRALGDDAVFEPCCFNAKATMVANCFATDNPTALKVNGDRLMATLWTTKVAGNEGFGDKFVKSFERFNDAFAALIKSVKFAVGVAHRGNDLRASVNSPK